MSRKAKRRPVAEINVVPYIDVMLVLLVIFMITAPLLNLGVEINLPQSGAAAMEDVEEPLIVTVDKNGDFFLNTEGRGELIDGETLMRKISVIVKRNANVEVLVGGDSEAQYGQVYQAMALLQQAGVAKVGLLSDPPEPEG
ncbi:MAG: protein TolR [Xanthomonadales bacterium]|jgi:biopolymer transport protein TolR|nr:protein TolR [Xanthomonadales bacterium]